LIILCIADSHIIIYTLCEKLYDKNHAHAFIIIVITNDFFLEVVVALKRAVLFVEEQT